MTRTGPLTGTGVLVRFILRRDRVRLPVWLAVLTLTQVGGAASYPDLYPTVADRQTQAAVMESNAAMKAMTGPGHGLEDYTIGAMVSNEYLGFMLVFVALMSVLLVVRHTRTEEEAGRAELVRAAVVGRHAPLAAVVGAVALANVVLGLLIAVGMAGLGIDSVDWAGSLTYGAAYTTVGLVFTAVAALTAQISGYGRAAAGAAGALIGVAYGLRAIGDVADNGLSWLSPIGWAQAAAAYVDNDWRPLALALAAALAVGAGAFGLAGRRDVGAGLWPDRAGPAYASPRLGTPLGLAWRLQRPATLWWAVGLLVGGFAYGSAVGVVADYAGNEVIRDLIADVGGATLTEAFVAMAVGLLAMVCTVFAILAVLRARREESAGRAEPVLATALSRTGWLASHVTIALVGSVALLALTGLGLGLGVAVSTGDAGSVGEIVVAALAYTPAVWFTAALAVTAFGLLPRLAGLAWALLVYAAFLIYFSGLLNLPQWMDSLSPYAHVPQLLVADFAAAPLVALTLAAGGLVALGMAGFRRRDVAGA